MRLKDRNRGPVGGFVYNDDELQRSFAAETLTKLIAKDANFRKSNGIAVPDNLGAMVEDQICMRQPPDRCWYENKPGDQIAKAIHYTARAIDKVLNTKLERKARGCGGCGSRRVKLNT